MGEKTLLARHLGYLRATPLRPTVGAGIYGSESVFFWGVGGEVLVILVLEKSKAIMEKAEGTSRLQACVGAVTNLIRVTDCSYLAYPLSMKGSSKKGIRIIIKKN